MMTNICDKTSPSYPQKLLKYKNAPDKIYYILTKALIFQSFSF